MAIIRTAARPTVAAMAYSPASMLAKAKAAFGFGPKMTAVRNVRGVRAIPTVTAVRATPRLRGVGGNYF